MRLSDLQGKDIVNVVDGKKIGNIIDVNITLDGNMVSLVVDKGRFLSRFSNKDEVEIKWDQVKKIGEDVILVSIDLI